MRSTSTAAMFSSAVLAVTCSLGTVRAQQAGVATPSLQQQLEAIDASLYKQPKSIDLLCVKAELLARQGSMAELRRCREQMMALFREQDDRIAQWLLDGRAERSEGERPGNEPGAEPDPNPYGPGAGVPPPGSRRPGSDGRSGKDSGGGSEDRGSVGKKPGGLLGAPNWKALPEPPEQQSPPVGPPLDEQFEQAVQAHGDGDDQVAGAKVGGALLGAAIRRSPAPAMTAQLTRGLPEELRKYLVAGLADLLAMLLDRSASSGEPASAERSAEQAAYVGELMAQLDLHAEAIAALERSAALRKQVRPVVAAISYLLQSWVARIDILDEQQQEELVRQQQLLLDVLQRLHAVQSCLPAVEHATRGLSKSRTAAADEARKLLADWCAEHLRRARQFLADEKLEDAAAENEQAFACDNGQRGALAEAAEQRDQLGQPHARVRHLKYLARTEGEHAETSRAELARLWQEASAELIPALEELLRTYSQQRAEGLLALLRDYPILAGKEEEELLDAHEAGDVTAVGKIVRELLRQLKGEGQVEASPLGPVGNAPKQGEDFESPLGQVPYRWVAARGDEEGFWVAARVVDTTMWKALLTDVDMADDQGGKAGVSYNSALRLCSALNSDEAAADRLPSGYEYALPTVAEIERMRDANGRLPFENASRVLSADPSGQRDRYGECRKACAVTGDAVMSVASWIIDANMGVFFVLRRK